MPLRSSLPRSLSQSLMLRSLSAELLPPPPPPPPGLSPSSSPSFFVQIPGFERGEGGDISRSLLRDRPAEPEPLPPPLPPLLPPVDQGAGAGAGADESFEVGIPGVVGGLKTGSLAAEVAAALAPEDEEEDGGFTSLCLPAAAAAAAAAARAAASTASSRASSARSAAMSASVLLPAGLKAEMGRNAGGRFTKRPFSRGRVATSRCFREETPLAAATSAELPITPTREQHTRDGASARHRGQRAPGKGDRELRWFLQAPQHSRRAVKKTKSRCHIHAVKFRGIKYCGRIFVIPGFANAK